MSLRVSVIVPVLDEGPGLARVLASARGAWQCIVVDGGSSDDSVSVAHRCAATVLVGERGRALQMNLGAQAANGDLLLFLHADTRLPADWREQIQRRIGLAPDGWGRFDVRLDDPALLLRLVAGMMNLRSRFTGICTGDQAIFVSRRAWDRAGGFAPIALMEDIELSARLRRQAGWPKCIASPVRVSARRWRRCGILRTIMSMWRIRLAYWLGASPDALRERYYGREAERMIR